MGTGVLLGLVFCRAALCNVQWTWVSNFNKICMAAHMIKMDHRRFLMQSRCEYQFSRIRYLNETKTKVRWRGVFSARPSISFSSYNVHCAYHYTQYISYYLHTMIQPNP